MKTLGILLICVIASEAKDTQGLWNQKEAKRAGLTMQAALYERKAALAAALVEMYKTKHDMKKAHQQYAAEKVNWSKSQKLVMQAANAHPLPNKHVAKAAVQEKVAIEAARQMKQLESHATPKQKQLYEKVYQIEEKNQKLAHDVLATADHDLKALPKYENELTDLQKKIAIETKQRKSLMALAHQDMTKVETEKNGGQKKKDAQRAYNDAQKLALVDTDLKDLWGDESEIDKKVYKADGKLAFSGIGADVDIEHKRAKKAQQDYTTAKRQHDQYAADWKSGHVSNYDKIMKELSPELGSQIGKNLRASMSKEDQKISAWVKSEGSSQTSTASASGSTQTVVYAGAGVVVLLVIAIAVFAGKSGGNSGYQEVPSS